MRVNLIRQKSAPFKNVLLDLKCHIFCRLRSLVTRSWHAFLKRRGTSSSMLNAPIYVTISYSQFKFTTDLERTQSWPPNRKQSLFGTGEGRQSCVCWHHNKSAMRMRCPTDFWRLSHSRCWNRRWCTAQVAFDRTEQTIWVSRDPGHMTRWKTRSNSSRWSWKPFLKKTAFSQWMYQPLAEYSKENTMYTTQPVIQPVA